VHGTLFFAPHPHLAAARGGRPDALETEQAATSS